MADVAAALSAALADRYRVEHELGAGGMATVYLAEDLKHKRKVALKVLKPELAAVLGADRFVQEITTTAALQHPHILPLFDSGTAAGFLYYVMPFIEGETLRERLNRDAQLGVDEAVRIATDVADALQYAHEHGVIHRDIKPENILLANGRPLVADFGIALAVSAAAGGRMTETGLSLGTPHYMSPEQATADRNITARADVYSLASVLYEMLSGEPPHTGATAQAIIMKIIAEPVQPVTELRKAVPSNVAAAVAKALEKLPADRFESAKAFADALTNPAFSTGMAAADVPGTRGMQVLGRRVSWRTVAAVASALAVAFAALSAWLMVRTSGAASGAMVTRAELDVLTRTDSLVYLYGLDISPDGSAFVYSARQLPDTTYRLYLRRTDERTAHAIPGTEGARYPAFSPDGQSIAFVFGRREIRRVPVTGVVVESVAREASDNAYILGLRWSPDGYLYYDNDGAAGLTRVPARGGTPEAFLGGDPEYPDPLPDGRHVLYTECCSDSSDVRVVDAVTGKTQSLGVRAGVVRYLSAGYLLLETGDALKAVAFDARRLAVKGEPFSVLDSVTANGSVLDFAVTRNGTAVYTVRPQTSGGRSVVALVDLAGHEERLSLPAAGYGVIRFSSDGRRLAYTTYPSDIDTLWVHDLLLGTTSVGAVGGRLNGLVWTPDGLRVVYGGFNRRDSSAALVSFRADGTGRPDTLLKDRYAPPATYGVPSPLSISPDGHRVLLQARLTNNADLLVARWDSTFGPVADYLAANWREFQGALSPDGRWVAYMSDEERNTPGAPQWRIYVRSFPEPGERFTISDSLGLGPRWSPDGRTIYYWRGNTLVAASVRTAPSFAVTGQRDLFTRPGAQYYAYDVHPDGKRFVMPVSPTSGNAAASSGFVPMRLVLVANWLEEFRRKAEGRE